MLNSRKYRCDDRTIARWNRTAENNGKNTRLYSIGDQIHLKFILVVLIKDQTKIMEIQQYGTNQTTTKLWVDERLRISTNIGGNIHNQLFHYAIQQVLMILELDYKLLPISDGNIK